MRIAIYARISLAKDETETAVQRQLDLCRVKAAELGATATVEFVDNSISAYSGKKRPQFEQLLEDLKAKRFDAVVTYAVDRLYRRLGDLTRVIAAADDVPIHTVSSGEKIDLSTASGRTTASILAAVAEGESGRHAERRQHANAARRVAGMWRKEGSRPFGFNGDGSHRQPEADMIRVAVKDLLSGTSLHAIARRWNESGITTVRGRQWSNLHVRRVLSNARLAALVVHRGDEVGAGNWEPIVDLVSWRALQALFATRAHEMAFERKYLLSGVALCWKCGRPLYAQFAHGPDRNPTYACRDGGHVARAVAPLDEMIEDIVVPYLEQQGVERDVANRHSDTSALEDRRAALVSTRKSLAGMMRRGLLGEEEVTEQALDIQREIADIDLKIADRKPALHLLDGSLVDTWNDADIEAKAAIVDKLLWIVVKPAGRGARKFDRDLIWWDWRR
ncbi:recombinase family protein [Mycolicibacterium conceptionense]|uniref:recombinase family protein n=1 Tax=Mycolicibacterium conceptionense TaxID=451644 RepID=UPI0007ECBB7F|nr:recombinase family protein [Mycolicibacterium conceptionense]OBK07267.1 hypothetical protein A5639_15885 [Mycolicibacterium conceptionense]